jgi:hypothetical protein
MDSSDKDRNHQAANKDPENPFITFRQFADEAMASLLQSFVGIPSSTLSNSHESRWQAYDEEIRRRAETAYNDEAKRRLENTTQEQCPITGAFVHGMTLPQDFDNLMQALGQASDHQSFLRAKGRLREYISGRDLVQEINNLSGNHSEAYDSFPRGDSLIHGYYYPAGSWPVEYIMASNYSPLALEKDELPHKKGEWRNAFQDLLDITDGEEMCPQRLRPNPMSRKEWIRYMVQGVSPEGHCRIPTALRTLAAFRPKKEDRAPKDENGMTELDVYEHFLKSQFKQAKQLSPVEHGAETPQAETEKERTDPFKPVAEKKDLGIISTLTTTERTVMPDGTVRMKMTLKKRFVDGREESIETVHNTQGGQEQQHGPSTATNASTQIPPSASDRVKEKKQSKGWFWG